MEAPEILLLPPAIRESVPVKDVPIFRRKRYFLVIMISLGLCIMNLLRCTLPTAIVDMTTPKNITMGNQVFVHVAEFKWTTFENGMLLGIRQCLGVVCVIGGILSCRFGSIKTLGFSLLLNGVFTLIFPLTVHSSKPIFYLGRILDGTAYSLAVGSWTQAFVKWAPTDELSRMTDTALSGFFIGAVIAFPVCGVIIDKWGWSSVFYVNGSIMILWWIIWAIFIYDDPSKDKFISKKEKFYILKNTKPTSDQHHYPFKKILTSKACWAVINERFVEAWTISFALECLPIYVKDSLDVSMSEVGFIASIPQICHFLGVLFGGHLNDFLRNHEILRPHNSVPTCIFYNSLGIMMTSRALVLASEISVAVLYGFLGLIDNFIISACVMSLLRFAYGWASSTYAVLPIEIVGEYAGLLHGIATGSMAVGYVFNPILISLIVQNHTPTEWQHYFLILSGLNLWAASIFFFFGSGQPETWSNVEEKPIHYELVEMKENDQLKQKT